MSKFLSNAQHWLFILLLGVSIGAIGLVMIIQLCNPLFGECSPELWLKASIPGTCLAIMSLFSFIEKLQ